VVGANEEGHHYVGAKSDVDFTVDEWADITVVKEGDLCAQCGSILEGARGIEVSQVFQLGDKYSKSMGATFSAEDGSEQHFLMGCYGVGVTRSMAAIVEQYNDDKGIIWPISVAPAHVCVIPLDVEEGEVFSTAQKLAADFAALGFEVALDDRDERAGVKFNDADLIGWPIQVVVGKRGLGEAKVEMKVRKSGEKKDVALDAIADVLRDTL
jgi:prolyl-tRNA synthetase